MCGYINSFAHTYMFSYEGAATLLVFFILYLKLHLGRKAVAIDHKEMAVVIPSEVTFLVMGFQLSNIIKDSTANISNSEGIVKLLVSLFIFGFQVVSVQGMKDKLSGKLGLKIKIRILFMYFLSLFIYIYEIFGGIK